VAVATINTLRAAKGEAVLTAEQMHQQQLIRYIPFPDALRGKYQSYTQADIAALRDTGYAESFLTVEQGTARYVNYMLEKAK
jgi:ADP-L-glycero-D-manno-heptose 6-epimerase